MRVDAFHYDLPPVLIAQRPAPDRELARLMSLPPDGGVPEHRRVTELPDLLPSGALVIVNDTRVIPARLLGRRRETGGRVEVLLVRRTGQCEIEVAPGDHTLTLSKAGFQTWSRTLKATGGSVNINAELESLSK